MTTLAAHEYLVKVLTDRFWAERECRDLRCETCDSDDPNSCKNLAAAAISEMTKFDLRVVPKSADNPMILAIHGDAGIDFAEAASAWNAALEAAPDYAGVRP